MRARFVAVSSVVIVFSALACSDASVGDGSGLVTAPGTANVTHDLNTVDGLIGALFSRGMEDAATHRWASVESALARNNTRVARVLMTQLASFALRMEAQEQLDDPDGDGSMTVRDGVLRLISLMFGEVYPGAEPPPTNLTGDFVVAVVDGSRQTVVTPAQFAGVQFPAGAAPEPFVLVIRETPFFSEVPCAGPLRTSLCQYPRFYNFTPYPHVDLDRAAAFGVCHVTDGEFAPGKAVDARLRLAHDAPADAPREGYQTVEGAEILPLAQVSFLECDPEPETPPVDVIGDIGSLREAWDVGGRLVAGLGTLAKKVLLPREAFAIDLGGGGMSDRFSNFNVVDPGPPRESPPVLVIDPRKPKLPKRDF
jgi:hypothetical protein